MKKLIVISAINLRSGGPLSILHDFLNYLDTSVASSYKIIALIHNKSIAPDTKNINYIEFEKSASSYLYRFYYEYLYFYKLSKKLNPYLWLSLHDMTPRVKANIRAVYCHNPAPFFKLTRKIFFLDKGFALYNWFYKFVYRINIHKNDFVIVQQNWIKHEFKKMFSVENIIVANPNVDISIPVNIKKTNKDKKIFFFPSFPRVFKNFEVICEAVCKLDEKYNDKFEVLITLRGHENKYAKMIYKKYSNLKNVKFIGLQTRKKVFEIYAKSDCLIFPSKLETWGLPISEYKLFNKPILAADLPYAHETVGDYDKVNFFKPDDSKMLAEHLTTFLENKSFFIKHYEDKTDNPTIKNWGQLFDTLLNNKASK